VLFQLFRVSQTHPPPMTASCGTKKNNPLVNKKSNAKAKAKERGNDRGEDKEESVWEGVKLGFYVVGVWVSFLLFGWGQEALANESFDGEKFEFTHSQVLMQSITNVLVAGIFIVIQSAFDGSPIRLNAGVRLRHWLIASLGYQGAHYFGFKSLSYISYPVAIVVKSCKSVPVLIGEICIAGETACLVKWSSVVTLSLGVVLFLFFKPSSNPNTGKSGDFSAGSNDEFALTPEFGYGMLLIFLALICDGIYGPYQSYIRKTYHQCGAFHLMFNMNLWQGIFSFGCAYADGELVETFEFIRRHRRVIPYLVNFCASMAVGSCFIYQLQRTWGALMVSKATTVRKLMSVLISAYLFGHDIHAVQWIGVLVVFSSKFTARPIATSIRRGLGGYASGQPNKQKVG